MRIEPNSGPSRTTTVNQLIKLGCLNCQSAVGKIALIHDLIAERNVDVLVLLETWITSDLPSSILADVAPVSYSVYYQPRQLVQGAPTRGGSFAIVYYGTRSRFNAIRSPTGLRHPLLNCRSLVMECSRALTPSSAFTARHRCQLWCRSLRSCRLLSGLSLTIVRKTSFCWVT
jgi:hypothetical protein